MLNRWFGIVTLAFMLSVNAALWLRDVTPDWYAGTPPAARALNLESGQEICVQLGLFNEAGRRIGWAWTDSSRDEYLVKVRHLTVIRSLALPADVVTPMIKVDTALNYHGHATLDELRIHVFGLGVQVNLEGAFYPPNHFPCKWQVGSQRGEFDLPAESTRALGDVIRPFDGITGLTVGQSWRLHLLNPLAGVVPDWGARCMSNESLLVRVTGTEQIDYRGEPTPAFVLEADKMRAWITADGRLVRQDFELPLLGKLSLVDEPYDPATRERVLSEVRLRAGN